MQQNKAGGEGGNQSCIDLAFHQRYSTKFTLGGKHKVDLQQGLISEHKGLEKLQQGILFNEPMVLPAPQLGQLAKG